MLPNPTAKTADKERLATSVYPLQTGISLFHKARADPTANGPLWTGSAFPRSEAYDSRYRGRVPHLKQVLIAA